MKDSGTGPCIILFDAHVHIYRCFEIGQFLDSALKNFRHAAQGYSSEESLNFVLFLTEAPGIDFFSALLQDTEQNGGKLNQDWVLHHTDEEESIRASHTCGKSLHIITGRQVITTENLEVHALGTHYQDHNRRPAAEMIQNVMNHEGIPALPWGVGKWFGKRGRIVAQLMNEYREKVLLSDNGGRPIFWPTPLLLRKALDSEILVVRGSDPLPIPSGQRKPGSFGSIISAEFCPSTPAYSMKNAFRGLSQQPAFYGTLENPLRFFQNQFLMQIRKKKRSG